MTTAKPKRANPHSHLTSGPQIKALAAECDRLKGINAELLATLKTARNLLFHTNGDRTSPTILEIDAAISKAEFRG